MYKITTFPGVARKNPQTHAPGEVKNISSFEDLHNLVQTTAWAPGIFVDNYRKGSNFIESSLAALDIDDGLSCAQAIERLELYKLKYSITFSQSHLKNKEGRGVKERFRIIIPLSELATSKPIYETTILELLKIFPEADQACKDCARYFFPSSSSLATPLLSLSGIEFPTSQVEESDKKSTTAIDNIVKELNKKDRKSIVYFGPDTLYFLQNAFTGLPGSWNNSLNKAAFDMARGGLDKTMITAIIAKFSPESLSDADKKTIESGVSNGKNHRRSSTAKIPESFIYEFLNEEFVGKFHVVEDFMGNREQYYEELDGKILRPVSEFKITSTISALLKDKLAIFQPIKQCETHAKNWIGMTAPTNHEIIPVAFSNSNEYSYHKLDFLPEPGETPVFDEFISRCTNGPALMAYTWSLFEPEADRQQYLWMEGSGGDGKSSYIRFMAELMGPSFISEDANGAYNNRFFTASLIGKRLASFSDSNCVTFVKSGLFKELTGGDYLKIEEKFKKPYSVKLQTKFVFSSNMLPEISAIKADQRRIILVEVAPVEVAPDNSYNKKLWAERSAILHKCREVYNEIVVNHNTIPCDMESSEDLGMVADMPFENLFNQAFKISEDSIGMTKQEVYDVISSKIGRTIKIYQFFSWIEKEKGIKYSRPSKGSDNRKRIYKGLVLR